MSLTPEEQKTLEAIEAAKAAGDDPFGDDEPMGEEPEQEPAADADRTGADDNTGTDDDSGPADEQAAEANPEPTTAPEPAAEPVAVPVIDAPQQYRAEMPADYKAQRQALLAEKATAMEKLLGGEIEASEFAATEARIADALEELTAARIRAETLAEANVQSQQVYQQRAIQRLVAKTKAEVDYASDADARGQFDTALQVVAAQPKNSGKDYADLIEEAHTLVKAMRGVAAVKQAPASVKSDPNRKPSGDPPPVTLRSLPSASTPNAGGSVVEQLSRLKGPEYELAFSKLTPAQRAQMLDAD